MAQTVQFPIVFEKKCRDGYVLFIENNNPDTGFRIVCTNKDKECFCIYLDSYKFVCHPWVTSSRRTGFRISAFEPIEQRDTVTLATNGITIKYLPEGHVFYMGEHHVGSYSGNGFNAVVSALDARIDSNKLTDYHSEFWNYHRQIITEKKEYEKLRLMAVDYHKIEADTRAEGSNIYILTVDPLSEIVRKNEEALIERGVAKPEPDDEADIETPEAVQNRYFEKLNKKMNIKLPSSIEGGLGILAVTKGFVQSDNGKWLLTIGVADGQNVSTTDIKPTGTLTERLNTEFKHKEKTLDLIEENKHAWRNMNNVVTLKGCDPIIMTDSVSLTEKEKKRFTENQVNAINMAINTDDFLLIQGPPGTGKTTIIAKIVDDFVSKNQRILICSKNNLAVDNVLDKWIEINSKRFQNHLCLRLGDVDSIKIDSVKDYTTEKITARVQELIYGRSDQAHKKLLEDVEKQLEELDKIDEASLEILELARFFCELSVKLPPLSVAYDQFIKLPKALADIGFPIDLGNLWYKSQATKEALRLCRNGLFEPLLKAFYSKHPLSTEEIDKIAFAYRDICKNVAIATDETDVSGALVKLLFRHNDKNLIEIRQNLRGLAGQINSYQKKISNLYAFGGNNVLRNNENSNIAKYSTNDILKMAPKQCKLAFDELLDSHKNASFSKRFTLSRIRDVLAEWHRELLDNGSEQLEETIVKESIKIIGATCMGVNSDPNFKDTVYDAIIVDEAGQIPLHDILVPVSKAKKVILIGDHLQLPPMSEEDFIEYYKKLHASDDENNNTDGAQKSDKSYEPEDPKKVFAVSLFEKLYRCDNMRVARTMLNTQYRMHPDIAEFISKNFYNGEYESGVENDDRELSIAGFNKPIYFYDTKDCEDKVEECHNPGCSNNLEAELCSDILVRLIPEIENGNYKIRDNASLAIKDTASNIIGYDIGVISGYDKQVKLIKAKTFAKLKSVCGYSEEKALEIMDKFMVSSVDSFQGRDNEIIIFSMTRSNKKGKIGFLRDVRRLNVAMTRAKSMLIMIGDTDTLTQSKQMTEHDENTPASSYYVALKEYCKNKEYYKCEKHFKF